MPCSCHGAKGEVVQSRVLPDDPCTVCASKHINLAATAWGEFTYELDNREFVAGHLRLAAEHLKVNHKMLALDVRDAAIAIEMARDKHKAEIANRIKVLQAAVRVAFNLEHPDVFDRLDKLAPVHTPGTVDFIIPLSNGSPFNNDELRILLRSIERNCTALGRIIIVSDCAPAWLDRSAVEVFERPDTERHNKDANLINKTLDAIEAYGVKSFIWSCDDHVVMKPLDLRVAPKLFNPRGPAAFTGEHTWHKRMRNTFNTFPSLKCNFDTHTPQPFVHAALLPKAMRGVDYMTEPGLCILTTFYSVLGETGGALNQHDYKMTAEGPVPPTFDPAAKLYFGYNDTGFSGVRDKLFNIFSEKSRFELWAS